ncbi:hypothetical protein D1AOALGA4SA_3551 [Olavius algarvensis Delta 1 endosymbiont]|nr:hypothetical protein D1AOALGA4SA_3551 [Olavius algarvensis Delta 1 endosymbiont]
MGRRPFSQFRILNALPYALCSICLFFLNSAIQFCPLSSDLCHLSSVI